MPTIVPVYLTRDVPPPVGVLVWGQFEGVDTWRAVTLGHADQWFDAEGDEPRRIGSVGPVRWTSWRSATPPQNHPYPVYR